MATSTKASPKWDGKSFGVTPDHGTCIDDQLIDELVGRAQAEGLQLTGEGEIIPLGRTQAAQE
ncbi:hypothetical protein [Streptomyces sp. NPDC047079]|uniref:hypothetical protein n=1 Tax=Streptomyces sp. NPDC047079 TaxID=3154607 RepID=UPI003400CA9C